MIENLFFIHLFSEYNDLLIIGLMKYVQNLSFVNFSSLHKTKNLHALVSLKQLSYKI